MADRKKNAKRPENLGFRIICSGASLFLTAVLAASTVRQMQQDRLFSGIISGMGTILFGFMAGILICGLIRSCGRNRK